MATPALKQQALSATPTGITADQLKSFYCVRNPDGSYSGPHQNPTASASADFSVFNTPSYQKEMNRSFFITAANKRNDNTASGYCGAVDNWNNFTRKLQGAAAPPPPQPQYIQEDDTKFNAWWLSPSDADGNRPAADVFSDLSKLPDVVWLSEGTAQTPTGSPLGPPTNTPGVVSDNGASDPQTAKPYNDGDVFPAPDGTLWELHVYGNPFTAGQTRRLWTKLQRGA